MSFGGYETIVREAANYQAKRNDAVYVIGRIEGVSGKIITSVVNGVTYIEVSNPMKRRPSSLDVGIIGIGMLFVEIFVSIWLLTPVVLRILLREKIDAVIFYGIHLMLMGPIVKIAGSKALLGLEVLQKNQEIGKASFLYWFRRLKYMCFNGIFTYTYYFYLDNKKYNNIKLLKKYAPKVPIAYIPWGIDMRIIDRISADSATRTWKKKTSSVIILCPRRLVEEKGVRYLLEAVPIIIKDIPNAYVLFAGDGILRDQLEKRAGVLGIRHHVKFLGFLSHKKTLEIMKASDVVVVPSSGEESFGMVFLEAYALHIPIISTWFGGISNVVKDNQSGILVQPKDSIALATAITDVLSNAKMRERFTQKGTELLKSEFNLSTVLDKLDAFTRSLS